MSEVPTKQRSVNIALRASEALDIVAANFERNKTSSTRTPDGGWTLERSYQRIIVYPKNPDDYLLEPLPEDFRSMFPETLGVQIEAVEIDGLTNVTARLIRRRLRATAAVVALDIFAVAGGLPLAYSAIHACDMANLRKNRRAAKVRLLRLAIEPLIPHEHATAGGPFRG